MFASFRLSMTWLHTWFGLVLGYVLIVVFFFGTLSVFDREIDRWAIPQTRFAPQPIPSFDRMLAPIFEQIQPKQSDIDAAGAAPKFTATEWTAYTTHRDPVLAMYVEYAVGKDPAAPDSTVYAQATIDPRDGHRLTGDPLKIGSEFFYPMHIGLHLTWHNVGYWIVGLAALSMLVALVTGLVIHRKVFREFFTFRLRKNRQRSTLDLHNLTGVAALPFHFFFALSGLTIFAGMYFPVSETLLRTQAQVAQVAEAQSRGLPATYAGVAAPLASVDAMVVEAKRRWAARGMAGDVGMIEVQRVGDRHSVVAIYRAGSDRVALLGQAIHFEGPTGRVLHEEPQATVVAGINDFLTGLHLQQFDHWLLRWFYVAGGLAGCACIVTGFLFFVEKRKRQHARQGLGGARWADAMAVTAVTGMLVAALALLVANRVLPESLDARNEWQQRAFWAAWLLAFAHAAWRGAPVRDARASPAWREQCVAIAGLAWSAVALNALTTGDHLLKTLARGNWPIAGLDLALLFTGACAAAVAFKLRGGTSAASLEVRHA